MTDDAIGALSRRTFVKTMTLTPDWRSRGR